MILVGSFVYAIANLFEVGKTSISQFSVLETFCFEVSLTFVVSLSSLLFSSYKFFIRWYNLNELNCILFSVFCSFNYIN